MKQQKTVSMVWLVMIHHVQLILCLITQGDEANSYYDQKEYVGRSVHYWKIVQPLLERVKNRRGIPEPLEPLFIHFPSKDIQVIAHIVCIRKKVCNFIPAYTLLTSGLINIIF